MPIHSNHVQTGNTIQQELMSFLKCRTLKSVTNIEIYSFIVNDTHNALVTKAFRFYALRKECYFLHAFIWLKSGSIQKIMAGATLVKWWISARGDFWYISTEHGIKWEYSYYT